MPKIVGPKLNITLARATGCFRQSVESLLNDNRASTLDDETTDSIGELEDALKKFEKFMYSRRHNILLIEKVVMFDYYDLA